MRSVAPHPRATIVSFALARSPAAVTVEMAASGLQFTSYDGFREAALDPRAFLVDADDDGAAEALLGRLRADPTHWLKPAFLTRIVGPRASSLADGVLDRVAEASAPIDAIAGMVRGLPNADLPADKELRLLRYLYTRPQLALAPVREWRHPRLYFFPLVTALAQDDADPSLWLGTLRSRGFLEAVELLDRLRLCPHCVHPHVTFIDVCPSCASLAIGEKSFLHCYACGNVAPQSDFLQSGTLVCRKCHATLRHIGVDYDRALESFACEGCAQIFTEPRVDARCLHCGRTTPSEELIVRRVESLRLTEAGRLAARTGQLGDVTAVLDDLNYTPVGYFRHTLDWLIALGRRHADIQTGVMCIRLVNLRELIDRVGQNRVMLMLDGLAGRLRELVRTTDLAARTSEEHFWLLLPQTPEAGCRVLLDRIRALAERTRQDDGSRIEIAAEFVVVPQHVAAGETAEFLMARVQAGLETAR